MQEQQEMQVWSLGQEDPLGKEMAPHSIILAWKIPWTEEPGGLQSKGSQRVWQDWLSMHSKKTHIDDTQEKNNKQKSWLLMFRNKK